MTRQIILRSFQSPGDVLMLTAAVRDLHLANPGQFLTDVRTSAPALLENNPYLTRLDEREQGVETIDCHYPLIHQSNARPYHFIHGYAQFLERRLGVKVALTRFAGDIHLSSEEQTRPLPFAELGLREGFWILMAGGKYDFTAKWWDPAGYQAVVDHFQGRIQFAQCGEAGHFHPPLERVVNLVGKTSLQEFVVLMHHAAGVLCPVTFAMHLAAAVPVKGFGVQGSGFSKEASASFLPLPPGEGRGEGGQHHRESFHSHPRLRPCVVVAGGREPAHWEQYPGHQFLHTIGTLDCCATGGCWKSRCQLVGDGDAKDRRDVCARPVQLTPELRIPQCMAVIRPGDVIRAIEPYLECGDSSPLSSVAERPSVTAQARECNSVGNALRGVPQTIADQAMQAALTPALSRRERESSDALTAAIAQTESAMKAAPRQEKAAMNRTQSKETRVLIDFRHGLGDAVQLTTLLLHLRHYHPDWQIDVACGVGKLPVIGQREQGSGFRVHGSGPAADAALLPLPPGEGRGEGGSNQTSALYHRLFVRGRDAIDRHAYQHVFELAWDECPACYADSPSTKAEYCLRTVFKLEPIPELCRYELNVSDDAMAKAKAYLELICPAGGLSHDRNPKSNPGAPGENPKSPRFPVVLLHYQANTSTDKKDLPHDLARRICETAIEAGYVPVILDWDRRSLLPDGVRIFNPGADHSLWGGLGTGDCETLAALIAQSSLFIGVDSGPLHVAGAGFTVQGSGFSDGEGASIQNRKSKIQNPPVLAVWTGHHPLHYFGLADHVTQLVPEDHASRLRGHAPTGLAFFEKHYAHRTYRRLDDALPALVQELLARDGDGLLRSHGFWIRSDNAEQDLVIVRDIAEEDSYRIAELDVPGPVVIDVGAHIGVFSRAFKARHPSARVVAVECCPENITALRRNVGDFAAIAPVALTYERDVALLNAVYPGCISTGGSTVIPRTELERLRGRDGNSVGKALCGVPRRVGTAHHLPLPPGEGRGEGGSRATDVHTPGSLSEYWLDGRPLPTITLEELMDEHGLDRIDVLKLDCEGSEFSILENTTSLDRIGAVIGEYHGRERFLDLVARKFGDWQLRILRDGDPGTFWLLSPESVRNALPVVPRVVASHDKQTRGRGDKEMDEENALRDFWQRFLNIVHPDDQPLPDTWQRYYGTLFRLAAELRPRRVCEIGVRAGYSAFTILSANPAAIMLGVEADFDEATHNTHGGRKGLCRHAEKILAPFAYQLLIADSHALARLPASDLIYIDGDHTFDGCLSDLHLAEHSTDAILVDDYDSIADVRRACEQFAAESPGLTARYIDNGLTGFCLFSASPDRPLGQPRRVRP